MVTPAAADIRAWSEVVFDDLGFGDDSDLQRILDQAISYIAFVTGRKPDVNLPADLDGLMQQALQMRTEQIVFQGQGDYVEGAADDLLQSFSAGPYSETRRDPSRGSKLINSWPALNDILWMLMTEDKYDYWLGRLEGLVAPAWIVTEVDWSGRYSLRGYGGPTLDPYPLPDPWALP